MFIHDGHTRQITDADLVRGHVVRSVNHEFTNAAYDPQASYAFSDCVILDVISINGRKLVKLARPYCHVANADTACPTVLTGVEQFEVSAEDLCREGQSYRLVVLSTGKPESHTT